MNVPKYITLKNAVLNILTHKSLQKNWCLHITTQLEFTSLMVVCFPISSISLPSDNCLLFNHFLFYIVLTQCLYLCISWINLHYLSQEFPSVKPDFSCFQRAAHPAHVCFPSSVSLRLGVLTSCCCYYKFPRTLWFNKTDLSVTGSVWAACMPFWGTLGETPVLWHFLVPPPLKFSVFCWGVMDLGHYISFRYAM